jgi:hypothetical protein
MKTLIALILMSQTLNVAYAVGQGAYFVSPKTPTEVQAAHDAFLKGDFNAMALHIRDALLAYPGDEAVLSDLLELYDKAYEIKGDQAITPDWSAPKELQWFIVSSKKKYNVSNGKQEYRINVSAGYDKSQDLEQFQVVRYPNEVLIDRKAGLGEITVTPDPSPSSPNCLDFWAAADYHAAQNPAGLYLMTLKMKGQEEVRGWFILGKTANASESPEVLSPTPDQVLTSATPSFAWKDFVSPQYRNFEKRKVTVAVVRCCPDVTDDTWVATRKAPFTEAAVGEQIPDAEVTGLKSLPSDAYVVQVTYKERRRFGSMVLSRDTSTQVPFTVRY